MQEILQKRFSAQLGEVAFEENLDQFVKAEYQGSSTAHDLYSAGAGFVQVVQLLAFVLTRNPSIVLLDEPDAHLHSSLQRVVVEILDEMARQKGLQVILATHSKEIINFVDPSRLLLIRAGEDSVSLIGDEVTPITVLRSLGNVDNVDAYTLIRNRRCFFIEGPDDELILSRFSGKWGFHHFLGDDRVVAVPVGGADRFEHIAQLEVLESFLGGAIASLELRDRDGRTDEHRQDLIDKAKRPLHVLELDSIESYLLISSVLARAVNERLVERGKEPAATGEGMKALCLAITDSMHDDAVDRCAQRFMTEVYAREKSYPNLPSANRAARELVEANWGTLDGRLRVVSGKVLLRGLRSRIQADYGVNFGNERLAEAFERDDIPTELVTLLQRVQDLKTLPA